jgi:hypothetical protein
MRAALDPSTPPITQRKKESHEHMVTFMDHTSTPFKQLKENAGKLAQRQRVPSAADSLLRQLEDSEKRVIISEKNYAEVLRKYEKVKESYDGAAKELEQ